MEYLIIQDHYFGRWLVLNDEWTIIANYPTLTSAEAAYPNAVKV